MGRMQSRFANWKDAQASAKERRGKGVEFKCFELFPLNKDGKAEKQSECYYIGAEKACDKIAKTGRYKMVPKRI